MTELDTEFLAATRAARRDFLIAVEEHRPALYRYCRGLTRDPWDAEDLVQDALAKAFAVAAQTHEPILRPLPWLLRVATNTWIDAVRRRREVPAEVADLAAVPAADPLEVRDALHELVAVLSPQERAALVLKDVFDLPVVEVARLVGTTEGAVKAALSRGRSRLAEDDREARKARTAPPARAVVDALAAAFTAYDIPRMTELFLEDAVGDVVGMVSEEGRAMIRDGSIMHTFALPREIRFRAEVHDYDGEPLVVLYQWPVDEQGRPAGPEAARDLVRLETRDGGIRRMRWYYFCPEVLVEVGGALGLDVETNGYRYD